MKLAIVDVNSRVPGALCPWAADSDCLTLLAKPVDAACFEDWKRPPLGAIDVEHVLETHLDFCESLFAAGADDLGPRAPGALIGFMAAADYALLQESRYDIALLLALQDALRRQKFECIELVSDQPDGGRCWRATRALAAAHGIKARLIPFGPDSRGLAKRCSDALTQASRRAHPAAPALVAYLRSVVKTLGRRTARQGPPTLTDTRSTPSAGCIRAAMLVYDPKSWRYVLPVRQALLAAGHETLLISPRSESDRALQALGLPYVSLSRTYPRLRLMREVRQYVRSLPLPFKTLTRDPSEEFCHAVRAVLVDVALNAAQIYVGLATPLASVLARDQINVVLGTDSGSVAGRCFFRSAERLGIPSVFMQHGAIINKPHVPKYFTESRLLIWGHSSRDNLTASGYSHPERIVDIGSPYQEERLDRGDDAAVPRSAPRARPLVLVAFGVPGGFMPEAPFLRSAREVISAARQLPEIDFVIKPHPGDRSRLWENLAAECRLANLSVRRDLDTYELLHSCRALLTMGSTTGAEAICLEKPVISINLDRLSMGVDYIMYGAAYVVDEPERLGDLLRSLIVDSRGPDRLADVRRRFAENFLHREERPAAERIVEYLEGLLLPRPVGQESPCARWSAWLQLQYGARLLSRPRAARDFWFHLYHEARRADRLVKPSLKYRLESRDAEELLPGISTQPFSLENFCEEYGGISLAEAKILTSSIQLLRPSVLFEFGTFNGATTVQLGLNASPDAVVHTIDLPEDHPLREDRSNVDVAPQRVGCRYLGSQVAGKIHQYYGNTAEFDFSPLAARCHWIFIDAAHTYDYVMSDTRNALKMLAPGGIIFWHDVNLAFDGNCRALAELSETLPIFRIRGTSLACYRS